MRLRNSVCVRKTTHFIHPNLSKQDTKKSLHKRDIPGCSKTVQTVLHGNRISGWHNWEHIQNGTKWDPPALSHCSGKYAFCDHISEMRLCPMKRII